MTGPIKLRSLLSNIAEISALPEHPALDQTINSLQTNSQLCKPGDLFIGIPGTRVDGGDFWAGALTAGAVAAVISPQAYDRRTASTPVAGPCLSDPCLIIATDAIRACATIAAKFYHYPAEQLQLIGITGTNGKTTTSHLTAFFLQQAQQATALFGTLYVRWPGFEQVSAHTTPFATTLQAQLAGAVTAGCRYGVMEVSSHALAQDRVWGCPFEVAVFTNLTQDHLDYHPTMDDYFEAKARLFRPDYLQGRAIVNHDDAYGQRLLDRVPKQQTWTYSIVNSEADLWTSDLIYSAIGVQGNLHTPQGIVPFSSPLVGQFNLSNLLAAVGTGLTLGLDLSSMMTALPSFPGVPGRMERIHIMPDQDITVIVDYAHTPDSLENLLRASRPFVQGQMVCVFGCGGDRDRTKRPKMAAIAATLADRLVVTSDNPRTEDPQQILKDVVAGIPTAANAIVLADRAEAIRHAIVQAQAGDGVLIAGKGHEDYQILGTEKVHFDDREEARTALKIRLGDFEKRLYP